MMYEKVEIKDICEIKSGKRLPKGTDFSSEITKYPYIRARDIKAGIINGDNLVYLDESVQKKIQRYIVNTNDIVITIVGASVGDVGYVKEEFNGFNLTENAIRLTNFDTRVNSRYLFYVLNSRKYWELMQQIAGGSAQPKLGIYKIETIPLKLPPIAIQNKIVDILKFYDCLIENNQKQIKLLEEAAQRLYKEWFVDLRFPGHEDVVIIDGVPKGWTLVKLSEVAIVNKQSISKEYFYDYIDYIDLGSVSKGHIEPPTRFAIQEAPGRAKRIASDGDIIWGMVRPNLKSYALVFNPTETSIFSTGFAVLSAEKVPFSFLYCHVIQEDFVGYLVNCTNGAAYPAVKPIHFEEAEILLPTNDILGQFHLNAEPMYREIEILQNQINRLKEARERLLPKLMSGEIEV